MENYSNSSGFALVEHIQQLNMPFLTGVEIGCAEGATTECYLDLFPSLRLYGIDPYTPFVDWNGIDIHQGIHDYSMARMREKTERFQERFLLIQDYSQNVHNKFGDLSLDFIFIDGLHTYEQVMADCQNYYSKIKVGGVFGGHDYSVISGVRQAVDEFARSMSVDTVLTGANDVWYWIKK